MILLSAALLGGAQAGMPLQALSYTVDVDGPLAEVRIDQTFVNDGDEAIEAVYVFPLHEQAAVDAMHMVVGERFLEGVIAERAEAEATYEEALEQGHTAALTTQERPNLFTQTVGNIAPGETVTVRLHVVQPVPHVDGSYELVLPLVAAPRFVSAEAWSDPSMPAHGLLEEGPPMVLGTTPLRAGLDITIDSGLPFTGFDASSHDVDLVHDGELALAVVDDVPVDRDFVLRWTVAQQRPAMSVHTMDGHVLLTLEPPTAPPRAHHVPRELVWVIDQSCSMSGQPIELVRAAMLQALDHADARDSVRILQFSDQVRGDATARPLTPDVLRDARRRIHTLNTQGGTYLLDGVKAALDAPADPERERMIVFLTDGLIGFEHDVLQAIADKVGHDRLFAFGVGPASNRWLLDEMAHFGGGRTTWLRDGEDPTEAVDRFLETIDRPVLTDIVIDWGDWEVADTWPQRLPALYAGQPLTLAARIVKRGSTPVVVHGRLGDGPFEARAQPVEARAGRAIPSTWARQSIAGMERQQIWGEDEELAERILAMSLEHQVMSQYTAFVAVDRSTVVSPGGPDHTEEQPSSLPHGTTWGLTGSPQGTVLSNGFLSRTPAGRSYASAVQLSAGVASSGAMAGTASSVSRIVVAQEHDPLPPHVRATQPGTVVAEHEVSTGHNSLETELGVHRVAAPITGFGSTFGHGTVSGPLVRDRAWAHTAYRYDQATFEARDHQRHDGTATLTVQPNVEHRTRVHGSVRRDRLEGVGETEVDQQVVDVHARHTYFLDPNFQGHVQVYGHDAALLGDRRFARGAEAYGRLQTYEHRMTASVDVDRLDWRATGTGLSTWLGTDIAPRGEVLRVGLAAENTWERSRLVVIAGLRSDLTLGRAHLGPRGSLGLDLWGDEQTTLRVGAARRFGHLGVATAALTPSAGLSRLDEVHIDVAQALVDDDLTLTWTGTGRSHEDVPQLGGGRVALRSWSSRLELRKWAGRRWHAHAVWTYAERDDALGLIDDGSIPGFRHAVDGAIGWSLPTDPWTASLLGTVGAFTDPLGTLVPDLTSGAMPNAPRWTLGARLSQAFALRGGHRLHLDLEGQHVALLDDPRDLSRYVLAQQLLPEQAGWGGLRLVGGLRYSF